MRKFYFALIMALSATIVGAAHNTAFKRVGGNRLASTHEKLVLSSHQTPDLDINAVKSLASKYNKNMLAPLSRAEADDSDFDFTDFTHWIFFDPDVNFYNDNGQQTGTYTDYLSTYIATMEQVGDSVRVYGFGSEDEMPYRFYITPNEEGRLVIKLGQNLVDGQVAFYVTENNVQKTKYFYVRLGAAFIENIDPSDPNSQQTLVNKTEGDINLMMDPDNMNVVFTDSYAFYVMLEDVDDPSAEWIRYKSIMMNQFCKPNATIGYEWLIFDVNGNYTVETINAPVYYEYAEAAYAPYPDEPNVLYDVYMVSNVTPYVVGLVSNIAMYEVDEIYSPTGFLWLADNQPIYPPVVTEDGYYTGKLYMNSISENFDFVSPAYPQVTFQERVYKDVNNQEYDALVFPQSVPDVNEKIGYWGMNSKTLDFADGYYTEAIIVFDFVGDVFTGTPEAGIQDVITDSYDGAPEYYDLQGIKVVNPVAGKLYIVKEGSKVTKRIFR